MASSLEAMEGWRVGGLDWLDKANLTVSAGEDCGYVNFMSTIDVLVMGRNSYEKVLSFGDWPYEKPVIVLSRNNVDIPQELRNRVSCSSESPEALCTRLTKEDVERIYVDGGAVIQSFLSAGLITDLTITQTPVLIGDGISLFGTITHDVELEHVSTKTYPCGFVQSKYVVKH